MHDITWVMYTQQTHTQICNLNINCEKKKQSLMDCLIALENTEIIQLLINHNLANAKWLDYANVVMFLLYFYCHTKQIAVRKKTKKKVSTQELG